VALEPCLLHAKGVEDELAVHLVKRRAHDLLDEDAGDHIAGV
jgi:hypothetical protein